jgi:hypothetical protein
MAELQVEEAEEQQVEMEGGIREQDENREHLSFIG